MAQFNTSPKAVDFTAKRRTASPILGRFCVLLFINDSDNETRAAADSTADVGLGTRVFWPRPDVGESESFASAASSRWRSSVSKTRGAKVA
jgi:hypothetical protein